MNAGVGPVLISYVLIANLETRRVVRGPVAVAISAELRFGMNPGAAADADQRSRRRLLTA